MEKGHRSCKQPLTTNPATSRQFHMTSVHLLCGQLCALSHGWGGLKTPPRGITVLFSRLTQGRPFSNQLRSGARCRTSEESQVRKPVRKDFPEQTLHHRVLVHEMGYRHAQGTLSCSLQGSVLMPSFCPGTLTWARSGRRPYSRAGVGI